MLQEFQLKEDIKQGIRQLQFVRGRTNIAAALRMMRDMFQNDR